MSAVSDFIGGAAKVWTSGVTYKQGQVVVSPADNYQAYVRITAAGSGATDPSADSTNYRPFGGRAIKSIQRGSIVVNAATVTATISAVNTARAVLYSLGNLGIVSGAAVIARLQLTNATTITATYVDRYGSAPTGNFNAEWQLVEYYG